MKKIFVIIFALIMLTSCNSEKQEAPKKTEQNDIIRGVWIYYNELSMKNEEGGTAESFKNKISSIFYDCKQLGLNTVFVQIRPFADSFYPSEIFPWSEYLTGKQGWSVNYDPLQIMIDCAENYGLSFHAWINPFRVSHNADITQLCKNHPVNRFTDTDEVFMNENGIYFNPAGVEAQKLILKGIREIVENYDVDGIHIDDYFYPTTQNDIDKKQYQNYVENGGEFPLEKWRTEIINAFVSAMYRTVKSVNQDIIVSISPAGNIDNNYQEQFADVKLWCSQTGYCDIIIPQIYFGFNHKSLPFEVAAKQWEKICVNSDISLICGIGAYKAVEPQNNETFDCNTIIRQAEIALSTNRYNGYCLFSYSSLISLRNKTKLSSDAVGKK